MTRVFPDLAGKRAPWFTIIHQNGASTVADIERVYLTYAYYDLEGHIDMSQHDNVAAQKAIDLYELYLIRDYTQVLPMRHAVKQPKLTTEERMALQARVSKDLNFAVSINMLLHMVI